MKKPRLSFWQIWNMSFGFLGIQFGFALQNANVSRIFETLGANIDDIPILWVAAPITGLIVQPIIGYMSDRTWNRLGRRRPYFLVGAILASAALFFMPNSPSLWIAAGMLWMMDATINITMEPFRAFVGDNLPDEQRTMGFAMQSFFIGIGAVVASLLPYMLTNWFGVSNEAGEGIIPDSVKWSFYVGGSIFLVAVLYTVIKSREYPPEELEAFTENTEKEVISQTALSNEEWVRRAASKIKAGGITLVLGAVLTFWFFSQGLKKDLYILSFGLLIFGVLFILAGLLQRSKNRSSFVTMIDDLQRMPVTMKQLAPVQFFSWFALFSMWIYTTAGITSSIYDMKMDGPQLNYLQTTAEQIQPADEEATKKLEGIKKNLGDLKIRLDKSGGTTAADVNVVNYFLDNKIIVEKDFVNQIHDGFMALNAPGQELDEAKKEMDDVWKRFNDGVNKNEKTLSSATFELILANKAQLLPNQDAVAEQKLNITARLKHILKEYNTGANWVGVCFGAYSLVSALVAFLLPVFASRIGRKATHAVCLVFGALGLISIFFFKTPNLLLVSMIGIGIAWASILSLPYAILTGALPASKMGYYMGVFNFFIVIPQIVAAAILGFFISQFFDNHAINAMLIGGVSFFAAAALTMLVQDKKG